jgi:hypothetical protein
VSGMIGREYLDPGDRLGGRFEPSRRCVVLTRWGPGGGPRNVAVRYLDSGQLAVIPFLAGCAGAEQRTSRDPSRRRGRPRPTHQCRWRHGRVRRRPGRGPQRGLVGRSVELLTRGGDPWAGHRNKGKEAGEVVRSDALRAVERVKGELVPDVGRETADGADRGL